jgi:hypothetical protein
MADVFLHFACGGGCEGEDGDLFLTLPNGVYVEVGGSEIIAPLREAMGFVHRDQVQRQMWKCIPETAGGQAFGG